MRGRRTVAVTGVFVALGLFVVANLGLEVWSRIRMERLGVVIYVAPEVVAKGGVVSIMTRTVPVDAFEARYPVPETRPDVPGAPRAARQWSATVSGPITMVFFEIPDNYSYTYRFRSLPREGVAEANVPEQVLVIGGRSYDAEGRDMSYVEFGVTRAHEIGQLVAARAWKPDILDYEAEDLVCQDGLGARSCVPTDSALKARAQYLTHTTPSVRGMKPWEQ